MILRIVSANNVVQETRNTFESTVGGYTVSSRAHSLSAWFVLSLRLVMGWAFAYSGFTTLTGPEPFSAGG